MHRHPKPTLVVLLIMFSFRSHAADELNLDFIQGGAKGNVPAVLSGSQKYPEGEYFVDIIFNRENIGRKVLRISSEEEQSLCLSEAWINDAQLPVKLEVMQAYYQAGKKCYELGKFPGAKVNFDYGAQTLNVSVPQIALLDKMSSDNWDYGIPGFHLTYSVNSSKTSTNREQVFGNTELNANAGRWVLYGRSSGFNGQGVTTSDATLSTAIGAVRGNFVMGKTQTMSTMLPDFVFYGVALRSDSNMVPWSQRGYAPVVSGVAMTNARVTVSQGGYIISSQIVPPGAYSLTNVNPAGNGDLTVMVEEENGTKTVRTYPVTTLPTLLRSGDFNYNFVSGTRENYIDKRQMYGQAQSVKGVFGLASMDYGFVPATLNSAFIVHSQYQSMGVGVTRDFGMPGAVAVSVNGSRSMFENDSSPVSSRHIQSGVSAQVKYAKGLTNSTNLQLLTYRFTGEKYVDFAEFNPHALYSDNSREARYEAVMTQSFGSSFLSASGWLQKYRRHGDESGANLSFSTSVNQVSLSLNASYGKYSDDSIDGLEDDYNTSVSVSVPFSIFERPHFSSTSVGYSRNGGTTVNTGVSGTLSDRVNYNLSSGAGQHSHSASAYAGVAFDPVQTGMSVSQSNNQTSMSFSASGAVVGTSPTGLLFTREQNATVAVVKAKGLPGVTFNGSRGTNKDGNTVMYITPYNNNDIRIDTEQVPDNVELMNTVYSVVPTERAIVYREFNYVDIKRYVLRLKRPDGQAVMAGSEARTEHGLDAGFVANGGVLLVNVLEAPERITITQQNGQTCHFSMKGMVPGENKTREVVCE